MNLSETEKAYLAGLLDGEETIGLGKTWDKCADRKTRYRLRISIVTTNLILASWLIEKTGAFAMLRDWMYDEFKRLNSRGPKSVTTNTPDMIAYSDAIMKIESELRGNVQRAIDDNAPPSIN